MSQQPDTSRTHHSDMRRALDNVASRLEKAPVLRDGEIVLRVSGPGGGTYVLSCHQGVTVREAASPGDLRDAPRVEVMGDADTIRAILDGEVDARRRFLQGGLRLRGDLRYFSDLAIELGLLRHPL